MRGDGRDRAVDMEQCIDGRLRRAHRVFHCEDHIVRDFDELADEREILSSTLYKGPGDMARPLRRSVLGSGPVVGTPGNYSLGGKIRLSNNAQTQKGSALASAPPCGRQAYVRAAGIQPRK